jgi:hypothetical protein
MIEIDASEFTETAQEVEDMSDGIERFDRKAGSGSHRQIIKREADRQLRETLLPAVKRNASRFVGEHSDDIHGVQISWQENTYTIGVGTESVIVRSHEYGSGRHATSAGRSGGTANGYRITARDDGPLRFSTPSGTIVTEFVVHPGVESQQFMKETTQKKSDDIMQEVLDAVVDELEHAIAPRR